MRPITLCMALALGLSAPGGAAVAGSDEPTVNETGDESSTGMPATEHQKQVLEGDVGSTVEDSGSPPGNTVDGMPSTEHQEQVLDEEDDAAEPEG